jgi:hypothetical protein
MNRRLALTIATTSALVVITSGAAVAANLGILSASPSSGVGQLDATRVAELAVATPASIEAVTAPQAAVVAPEVAQPQAPTTGQVSPAVRFVAPSSSEAIQSSPPAPATDPQTLAIRPDYSGTDHENDDEYDGEYETTVGSLDDHVQDDTVEVDTPHTIEAVVVSESDS